jgi:N-acetylglucosaminyl-diphospho-decaprenol L-rhamnosyltransferase
MKMIDVTIQIVNYKTKNFLNPLIDSILKDLRGSNLTFEINILDNNSGDDLRSFFTKWQNHGVHVYVSDKNGGFGAGHNMLAAKTNAQFLLILNPDLLFIEKNTIKRLIAVSNKKRVAVVGPRLLTPRSRQDRSLYNLSVDQLKQQPWDHFKYDKSVGLYHPHDELSEVAWVSGAVLLIARQQFVDAGGFDEKFFLYYEEVDLCRRLRMTGVKVFYDPSIQVLHYGSAVASHYSKHMMKSFLYFQFKKFRS